MVRPSLTDIEATILWLSSEQFGVSSELLSSATRPVQDLGIDSLDLIEWMMAVEEHFEVSLPDPKKVGDPVYKEVFTRADFTLRDMSELVHIRWGGGKSKRPHQSSSVHRSNESVAFSQLGGNLDRRPEAIYRPLEPSGNGVEQFRRMTDGMVCFKLPAASVEIGSNCDDALPDEKPVHKVRIEAFLIDRETVSTTAFCRFLNSIDRPQDTALRAWFQIAANERRFHHQLIEFSQNGWRPKTGVEDWPMILVTWHGANAYSLWANGEDWHKWQEGDGDFLPSEYQWEYAARGAEYQRWPWGDRAPRDGEINAGIHNRHARYEAYTDLPLAPVNDRSAVSPFGLLQMAGNVWEWCRDWYNPAGYRRSGDSSRSAEMSIRSERGGSWVSPISLSRSSYRRGRLPSARGRCLGFRCVGSLPSG